MRFADADGVTHGLVVHRREAQGLLPVLGQNQCIPRRGINRKSLGILEVALRLYLDAALLSIAHVSRDLQAAIGKAGFLDAGRCHGVLHAGIHQHKIGSILVIVLGRVLRQVRTFGCRATSKDSRSGNRSE